MRGYPKTIVERSLSGVTFASRQSALTKNKNDNGRKLPFVTGVPASSWKSETNIFGTMSLIQTNSAIAEKNLQQTSDNLIQKTEVNLLKTRS